jgi:multiple sugar transport system substrate-binding protein
LRAYAPAWAARHDAQVQMLEYDPQGPPPAAADVWVVAPCQLPRYISGGQAAMLAASFTLVHGSYNWSDVLPFYREGLLLWDEKPFAVPLLGEGRVCCYRADLFADPAHREAFRKQHGRELEAPGTWQQFAEIAQFFRERTGAPSLPPLPTEDQALDRDFYTVAACYARRAVSPEEEAGAGHLDEVFSFHYDLKTGKPRIATPGFCQALRLLQQLQRCRPSEAQAIPEQAFREGKAVLCLTDATWLAYFQQAPAVRDRIGVCAVPGGERYFTFATGRERHPGEPNRVPYLGGAGWLAAVPRTSAHAEAAFDLLAEITGPTTSGQMVLAPRWGGGPVRDAELRRERWDSYELETDPTLKLKQALQDELRHRALKNPVLCLRTPTEASHREALDTALRQALQQNRDASATLKEVEQRWVQLDAQETPQTVKADYRRSVGLLPEAQ